MASRKPTTTPTNKRTTAKSKGSKTKGPSESVSPQATLGEVAEANASKKAKGAPPPPRDNLVENFERMLPCKLTDVEVLEKSRERSYLGALIEQKESEIEQYKERVKTEIDRMKQDVTALVSQDKSLRLTIALGTIDRMTKCQRIKDWHLQSVREIRLDTMPPTQLGEPRCMTPNESDEGVASWVGTALEKATTKATEVPINNEADHDEDESSDDEPPAKGTEIKY
jgi:hypothetical protein